MENFLIEGKYLLGILLSVLLGFIIGFERKQRSKEAGVRTHTIVCFGSAIFVIISKFGFESGSFDTSRVAASIVSGIGFIGAGMIVFKKQSIHGLTTAAGVWATSAIGMACGSGLYLVAIGSTIILVGIQCVLHINCKAFNAKRTYELKIVFSCYTDENEKIKEIFGVKHFKKVVVTRDGEIINYTITLATETEFRSEKLNEIIRNNSFISSIERCIED